VKRYVEYPVADKEKCIRHLRLITQKERPECSWSSGVRRPLDPSISFSGWITEKYLRMMPIVVSGKSFDFTLYGEFLERDGQCFLRFRKPALLYGLRIFVYGFFAVYLLLGLILAREMSLALRIVFPIHFLVLAGGFTYAIKNLEEVYVTQPLAKIERVCRSCEPEKTFDKS